MSFIDGDSRDQISLLPACIGDYVAADSLVRVVDAFVASLDLAELGFNRVVRRQLADQDSSLVTCSASTFGAISTKSDHRDTSSAHASGTSKRFG